MKILLVGGGGREHALAWKLAQSPKCETLYCAPGNPGIAEVAECVSIGVEDVELLAKFAIEKEINFIVAGPEATLVAGLHDRMKVENMPVFGPTQSAARLEGSKSFTKDLCKRHNIPTAVYDRFTDITAAEDYIRKIGAPIVIKADGLAAGKGVVVAMTLDEALDAARDMLSGNAYGASGAEIVVEEFMDGEELSFFALTDGTNILPFASAQDHKRVGDGDVGPNTGGMGAYSPAHLLTPDLQAKIMDRIITPTVRGMAKDGVPYQGVLFAGIMVVNNDPYLIEYNARFGDPETQVMLTRFQDDLVETLYACACGKLDTVKPLSFSSHTALTVVMAAKGYPASYAKGGKISGIDKADAMEGVKVFHAGTTRNDAGDLVSSGGRVLNVTALGSDVATAQEQAYKAIDQIDWADGFCRRDIGWRAVRAAEDTAA
jgi:phosphoribosylamine--glycine ligase